MDCFISDVHRDDLKVIPSYESGIPKIPDNLIDRKPRAYKPRAISLGPVHFGDSDFEDYEKKKEQLLHDRFPYTARRFNPLVDSIISMDNLSRIQKWYHSYDSEIRETFREPWKLLSMMALDGIFLLESLREISRSISSSAEQRHALTNQEVQEDILKLQNQIPLFALEMIIQWEENTYKALSQAMLEPEEVEEKKLLQDELQARLGTNQNLGIILKGAWHSLSPFNVGEEPLILPGENAHILGFVYERILGEGTDLTQYDGKGNQKQRLPERAVALDKKGVKLAPYTGPLHEIRFDRNTGTLHLPKIEITERTDAVMRNLVAFELFGCQGPTKPMKCYVELMDQLINTAEDVEVLIKRGIVNHHLGSDQDVADIWNKIREGHDQNGKYGPIDTAIDDVIKFYGSFRIWFAEGVKKFFSKPWLVVSFIAGCIIVITAIVQTIFSGLQLHHH